MSDLEHPWGLPWTRCRHRVAPRGTAWHRVAPRTRDSEFCILPRTPFFPLSIGHMNPCSESRHCIGGCCNAAQCAGVVRGVPTSPFSHTALPAARGAPGEPLANFCLFFYHFVRESMLSTTSRFGKDDTLHGATKHEQVMPKRELNGGLPENLLSRVRGATRCHAVPYAVPCAVPYAVPRGAGTASTATPRLHWHGTGESNRGKGGCPPPLPMAPG